MQYAVCSRKCGRTVANKKERIQQLTMPATDRKHQQSLNCKTKHADDAIHCLVLPANRAASWHQNNAQKPTIGGHLIGTNSQRILTKGRITRKSGFFTWGVNVTPASQEQCSRLQQSRWRRYFLLHTPQQQITTLLWTEQLQKLDPALGDHDPPSNTWFLGST